MTVKNDHFDERYLQALRWELGRPRRDGATAGTVLGRAALAEGVDSAGLARTHGRALRILVPQSPENGDRRFVLRRADAFLLRVLVQLEAGRRKDARDHDGRARLNGAAAALARAERDLRLARARTARAETALAKGVRHHRELLSQAQVTQEQLRRMTRRVLSAQEEERKRISRELHDEVAQVLTGINVQLAILKQASTINDRGLRQRIAQAQRFVEKSMTAVHRFARELRPALLDDLGLVPALRSFIRNQPGRQTMELRLRAEDGVETLDSAARTALYRVAQEGIANAARHAHARHATVTVKRAPDGIGLTVCDDGRGFNVPVVLGSRTRKRLGLLGMRERIEMVGGTLTIESVLGEGTTIRAFVPLAKGGRRNTP